MDQFIPLLSLVILTALCEMWVGLVLRASLVQKFEVRKMDAKCAARDLRLSRVRPNGPAPAIGRPMLAVLRRDYATLEERRDLMLNIVTPRVAGDSSRDAEARLFILTPSKGSWSPWRDERIRRRASCPQSTQKEGNAGA